MRLGVGIVFAFPLLMFGSVAVIGGGMEDDAPSAVVIAFMQAACIGLGIVGAQIYQHDAVLVAKTSSNLDSFMRSVFQARPVSSPRDVGTLIARADMKNTEFIPENWPEERQGRVIESLALVAGVVALGVVPFVTTANAGTGEIAWGIWCGAIALIGMTAAFRQSLPERDSAVGRLEKVLIAMHVTLATALVLALLTAPYL
jgi:hypothetical protein